MEDIYEECEVNVYLQLDDKAIDHNEQLDDNKAKCITSGNPNTKGKKDKCMKTNHKDEPRHNFAVSPAAETGNDIQSSPTQTGNCTLTTRKRNIFIVCVYMEDIEESSCK